MAFSKRIIYIGFYFEIFLTQFIISDTVTENGDFSGPVPSQTSTELCNNKVQVKAVESSPSGWYNTNGDLFEYYGYDYYLINPGFTTTITDAHEFCSSIGAKVWCPEEPAEAVKVEFSFRKELNFTLWKNEQDMGIITGLSYIEEFPSNAFCYTLPFDEMQLVYDAVSQSQWNGQAETSSTNFNYWSGQTMAGTNRFKTKQTGIYLGGHRKVANAWRKSKFFAAPMNQPKHRPFLCQIICPAPDNDYGEDDATEIERAIEETSEIQLSDLNIHAEQTLVNRDFPKDIDNLLEKFLTEQQGINLKQHGCWCHKLDRYHSDYVGGPKTLDDLDFICKQWFQTRRCLKLENGTCKDSTKNEFYTLVEQSNCDNKNANLCSKDSCVVDVSFLEEISNFLKGQEDWSVKLGSEEACPKKEQKPEDEPAGTMRGISSNICVGQAPDLEIVRLQ